MNDKPVLSVLALLAFALGCQASQATSTPPAVSKPAVVTGSADVTPLQMIMSDHAFVELGSVQ